MPVLDPDLCLEIPVRDVGIGDDTRQDMLNQGQFLARQERWEDLSAQVREAETIGATTWDGTPVANLLTLGARMDVVSAAEHALGDTANASADTLRDGIAALEDVLEEYPDDYPVALTVALAHVDLGRIWRGTGWDATVPHANKERFQFHFQRARDILDPLCGIELGSPGIAAARCALLIADQDPHGRIADDYEDLIDLAPHDPLHMRQLGRHLLPRWFGDYDQLELEARRTAARTQDVWGAGAYAWVYADAIAEDEEACARVDVGFFIDGLKDIADAMPNQHMINLLTAYCAITLQPGLGYDSQADYARTQIADCAGWLIRDHLTEVHPAVWAEAAEGLGTAARRVTSSPRNQNRGKSDALNAICDQFADDILHGNRVRFTANGPEVLPA